jgi:lysophospholipase L1-like esterase
MNSIIKSPRNLVIANTVARTLEKMRAGLAVKIVCYGDSITYGYQPNTGVQVANPYPAILQTKLRALYANNGITVLNRGTSGWQTDDAVANVQAKVLADVPDLCIVMYGINDARGNGTSGAPLSLDEYKANLGTVIKAVRAIGSEVIVVSSNPIIDTTGGVHKKLLNYVRAAKEVAKTTGVGFVNMNSAVTRRFMNKTEVPATLFPDNIHFQDQKYEIIADTIIGEALNYHSPFEVIQVPAGRETHVPVVFSPYIDTDSTSVYSNAGQFFQKNQLLRSDGTSGTYLRFAFYVENGGMDLVLKSPKNTAGGIASVRDNGVVIKTIDFFTTETHVFGAEDVLIENITPGYHVIEFLVADMLKGKSQNGTAYGLAFLERFVFRPSKARPTPNQVYNRAAGGQLGKVEAFSPVLPGVTRWTSAAATETGIVLFEQDQAALKAGKTLVIEAEGTLFNGCGISWFSNKARGEADADNASGCNTGYLLYFEGNPGPAIQLYSFQVNNSYGVQLATNAGAINYAIPHKIRITHTDAGLITVMLDGVQVFQITNTDRNSGWFGLYSHFAGTMELTRLAYAYI